MRITSQQQGMVSQNEFAKFAMIGSNGEIELNPALTDDEGRDFEVHHRNRFGRGLSIQVKSVLQLRLRHANRYIDLFVWVPRGRVKASAYLWYFFAYLDPVRMEFANPSFLIPSLALHRLRPRLVGHRLAFTVEMNVSPTSRDKWSRYQVETRHIGRRLLQILAGIEKREREMEMLLAMDQAAA
jgi:hypothetical protein